MKKNAFAFLLAALILAVPFAVRAEECAAPAPEAIFRLIEREYPSNAVWDSVYGAQDAQERFINGMVLESGNVLVAGERFTQEKESAILFIAEIDRFGRPLWEQEHKIEGLRSVNSVIARKTGLVVAGRKRAGKGNAEIWLGFFDFGGKLLRQKSIRHAKFGLEPQDIVPLQKGSGYLMTASAEERGGVHHTVIYRLNADGGVISQKEFALGPDNSILSLAPANMDQYMGTGYIRSDDGRKTGWLLMIDKDAQIIWQRQYARGAGAQINRAANYAQDTMITAGESMPTGGKGPRAGWVMVVKQDNGDIIWQRYYTDALDQSARDVQIGKGGIFTVLLDGAAHEKSERPSSVRLLAINPRATVMLNDYFISGEGAHGLRLLSGPDDQRLMLGSTNMAHRKKEIPKMDQIAGPQFVPPKPEEEEEEISAEEDDGLVRSVDGWLIAAERVGTFADPCAQQ